MEFGMKKKMTSFAEIAGAPKAVGPYSPVVTCDGFAFLSGQVAIDPATSSLVSGGVEAQAHQVLKNLAAVLKGVGLTFHDVVKTTIFLTDLKDFQTVNAIYGEAMESHRPARSTFQVAGLPLGAVIEIEMIAALRG